jgi:transketolase
MWEVPARLLTMVTALLADDIAAIKAALGVKSEDQFAVPEAVYSHYRSTLGNRGEQSNLSWNNNLLQYADRFQEDHQELLRRIDGALPRDWARLLPVYGENDPAFGGRKYSEIILNQLSAYMPELLGGSADLTSSNYTRAKTAEDFQAPATGLGSYSGSYVRYGVREHAMGAIMNGLSAYGCFIPFAGTFLNFVSERGDSRP